MGAQPRACRPVEVEGGFNFQAIECELEEMETNSLHAENQWCPKTSMLFRSPGGETSFRTSALFGLNKFRSLGTRVKPN